MKILVAEDERSMARAIVKILEKNNYSAEAVYNGADALDYLETGNFDAAVLDVMMPQMDGIAGAYPGNDPGTENSGYKAAIWKPDTGSCSICAVFTFRQCSAGK